MILLLTLLILLVAGGVGCQWGPGGGISIGGILLIILIAYLLLGHGGL